MRKYLALSAVAVIASCSVYYVKQHNTETVSVELKGKAISEAPDFSAIADVSEKKHAFFSYLKPGIALENERVMKERKTLKRIQEHFDQGRTSEKDLEDAKRLAKLYKVELTESKVTSKWLSVMQHRVDVLPEALVLTQAANESAWGTSRFAREANNYFGQWCYTQGCGLVPLARAEGMTHEVAKFKSVQESIHRYFMNVNRNAAYYDLRKIRYDLRKEQSDILSVETAVALTNGLLKYSERGEDYVSDLQTMIRHNEKYWLN
ncbi:glucosaminidase domain-containing protein [Vibrio fluvialis]|uniref:glucosaminidase domain-containing protein n=1 Tax=Vibrio fluvialis TaxID=676 RepID=UPI001EEAE593|nr:glucosaminidase domain-containing protein [Vibrio fluvialis]MCG6343111.1 glucosaminidase domain-containing protein [Vibrio fluvialis]